MRTRHLSAVAGVAAIIIVGAASFVAFRPRPTRLEMTRRAGDDTVVVNQMRPDGRPVTELRGAVTLSDPSIVVAEGTTIRPKQPGQAFAMVEVGDAKSPIPIMVYQPVTSFAGHPKQMRLMAMRVRLARGDTLEVPLPKPAFWVTYFSKDRGLAPPTIELEGEGSCTTGDGLHQRRMEEGQYAKYCLAGNGTRLMISHGAAGSAIVSGVVALRLMW